MRKVLAIPQYILDWGCEFVAHGQNDSQISEFYLCFVFYGVVLKNILHLSCNLSKKYSPGKIMCPASPEKKKKN